MRSEGSDRRVRFGRRRWLLGLPVAALLCSAALVAPATSGAKAKVDVSVTASPNCVPFVTSTWTPVADQAFLIGEVTDTQTGVTKGTDVGINLSSDSSSVFVAAAPAFPLNAGRHVFRATISITNASGNPIITGTGYAPLPCAYLF